MRSRLTAVAVSLTLSLTGAATAHATAQTTNPPTIFMLDTLRDAGNNPHLVYTSCGDDNRALIHTVLYNDHGGPDETVVVYLEPNSGSGLNTLGVPVQNAQAVPSPIDIPAGGHVAITLPFENGSAVFDAVAVAKGGTVPTTAQELEAAEAAKTADNSQLFAPGAGTNGKYEYPAAPTGCTPPPWHPCPPNWPIDLYPVIQTCPVYVPPPPPVTHPTTSQPSTHPTTTHPTSKPSTHPSTTHTTATTTTPPKPVTHTSTTPSETPRQVTGTADATSPPVASLSTTAAASLAHTGGSSSTPLVVAALLLIVTGCTLVAAGLRKRGTHR